MPSIQLLPTVQKQRWRHMHEVRMLSASSGCVEPSQRLKRISSARSVNGPCAMF
jgi:hypothetical protein